MLYVTKPTKLGEGFTAYRTWPYALSLHPQVNPGSSGLEGGDHCLLPGWGIRGLGSSVTHQQSQQWYWGSPSKPQVLVPGTTLPSPTATGL